MQRPIANTKCNHRQGEFALRVKVALLERGLSISQLADQLGLARNTVSLAINRGLYEPTRRRIAEKLALK